ncbi:anthranilate synthase component I [Basilea psittacipulmonis]|uniref:Anthranilate synthase component 1 n=1 Tax=Basilea psittacipulmonis DSM 24701 TaxID=1072685 RepID=A0A077DE78_9BURK|nr:anthranilate synthase component I [Basilea psittacipulmonis]AIL32461.1 anthranilate synthase component I [Basilea psittacipulmonis DSM 24701]
MTEIEFNALAAQGYNRIPIVQETYADLDTTLGIYLKLAHSDKRHGRMSCLLESVVGGERFGRYSFIGLPAKTFIRSTGNITEVVTDDEVVERHEGDPLEFIKQYQERFKVRLSPGLPRFAGGLAGYFGYDTVRHIEPSLGPAVKPWPKDMKGVPDILLMQVDELVIVDNVIGRTYLVIYVDPSVEESYTKAQKRLIELRMNLRKPVEIPYSLASLVTEEIRDFKKEDYLNAVKKAKAHIEAGDLMQVQVGQVIAKPFRDAPLSLYRSLRSLNPSPYMYFWNFGDFQVVGSSPEILVRQEVVLNEELKEETNVVIRPLAGTRRRGETPAEDKMLAQDLLNDPKERAEHVMLIDLARNDIGRVAEIGSVTVTDQMVIENYSHVMHLVSNVKGKLKQGMNAIDILRATFPAGTLTGAPKVKAMEIIDELEPVRRGIYGGAAGYISYNGTMDLAIAIRTAIIKDGMLYVQASAGIVADSDPEKEWQETEHKARAVLRAAEQVQYGLDQPI